MILVESKKLIFYTLPKSLGSPKALGIVAIDEQRWKSRKGGSSNFCENPLGVEWESVHLGQNLNGDELQYFINLKLLTRVLLPLQFLQTFERWQSRRRYPGSTCRAPSWPGPVATRTRSHFRSGLLPEDNRELVRPTGWRRPTAFLCPGTWTAWRWCSCTPRRSIPV